MKKMNRAEVFKLIQLINAYVEKNVDLSKHLEEGDEPSEVDWQLQGVSNGFLSEVFFAMTGYEVEVTGEVVELFPCPCCRLKTLTEIYNPPEGEGYDICSYCKWEDDGTTGINSHSSVNRGTIRDYRNKITKDFNKYYIDKWLK